MILQPWQEAYWIRGFEKIIPLPKNCDRVRQKKQIRLNQIIQNWQQQVEEANPKFNQCKHLIDKFGGIVLFSIAVGVHPVWIIKYWLEEPDTPPTKTNILFENLRASATKTSGLVPTQYLAKVMIVARHWGVLLQPEDLYPEFIGEDGVRFYNNREEIIRWLKTLHPDVPMREFETLASEVVKGV